MKRLLLGLVFAAVALPSAAAPIDEILKCPMNRWKIEIPGAEDPDGPRLTPILTFAGETEEAQAKREKERVLLKLLRIPGLEIECDRGRGAITISN